MLSVKCFRGPSHSVHGLGVAIMGARKIRLLTCKSVEPPIGIEPMTYALRGPRSLSAHALSAIPEVLRVNPCGTGS